MSKLDKLDVLKYWVQEKNRSLTCRDLRDDIFIEHLDGSMFMLWSSTFQSVSMIKDDEANYTVDEDVINGSHIVVFSEHHTPHVWPMDEIADFHIIKGPTQISLLFKRYLTGYKRGRIPALELNGVIEKVSPIRRLINRIRGNKDG